MKTFFLIVALCVSVAVATPDDELNNIIAACLRKAKYTAQAYRDQCANPQPEDIKEIAILHKMVACIYEGAKIVYKKFFFGTIVISSTNASKLVTPRDARKVIDAVRSCKEFAKDTNDINLPTVDTNNSSVLTVVFRLNYCLYKHYTKLAVEICLSLIAGVHEDDGMRAPNVQLRLESKKQNSIEWVKLDDDKA